MNDRILCSACGKFSFGNGALLQSDARILVGLGLGGMKVVIAAPFAPETTFLRNLFEGLCSTSSLLF